MSAFEISSGSSVSRSSAICSSLRLVLVGSSTHAAVMAGGLTALAIIGVRADEHAAALVVGDDLVEIRVLGAAQRARRVETIGLERVIFEIERHHLRVRRD